MASRQEAFLERIEVGAHGACVTIESPVIFVMV